VVDKEVSGQQARLDNLQWNSESQTAILVTVDLSINQSTFIWNCKLT